MDRRRAISNWDRGAHALWTFILWAGLALQVIGFWKVNQVSSPDGVEKVLAGATLVGTGFTLGMSAYLIDLWATRRRAGVGVWLMARRASWE